MSSNQSTNDPLSIELAKGFTIRDYEKARDSADVITIAEGIRKRFSERYIDPISEKPTHGFTIIAISCLLIETLESFRQGWETSDGQHKAAFCFFFDATEPMKDFRGHSQEFYKHVRCGLLHQAETTGGWRIRRDSSPLFDPINRIINADLFLEALHKSLDEFCDELKVAPWDSQLWEHIRYKMNSIVRHCKI
jgi:hypothetical protein